MEAIESLEGARALEEVDFDPRAADEAGTMGHSVLVPPADGVDPVPRRWFFDDGAALPDGESGGEIISLSGLPLSEWIQRC